MSAQIADEAQKYMCKEQFPVHKQYDVIVVDPPWTYKSASKSKKFRGVTPYPTMTMGELKQLPMLAVAAENCALLVWCTGPQLPEVFPLMKGWGFTYKTMFLVWKKVYANGKPVFGVGHYTRPCHEYLLLAVKGSVISLRQCRNLSQLLESDAEADSCVTMRAQHSVKPQRSFDVIEEFFGPHTKKLELFARQSRLGWDSWGLDLFPQYFREDRENKRLGDVAFL